MTTVEEPEVFWCIYCLKGIWWFPRSPNDLPVCDDCVEKRENQ